MILLYYFEKWFQRQKTFENDLYENVYVFQVWFIMVKAWSDKVWFNANFYVHIKSQCHHGVYGPHDEKTGLCVERSV